MATHSKLPGPPHSDFKSAYREFLRWCRSVVGRFDNQLVLSSLAGPKRPDELALVYEPLFDRGLADFRDLGFAVGELAPEGFPIQKFIGGLVRAAEELALALDRQAHEMANHEAMRSAGADASQLAPWIAFLLESERDVRAKWRLVREQYFEIQDELRYFEVRAGLARETAGFEWRVPPIADVPIPEGEGAERPVSEATPETVAAGDVSLEPAEIEARLKRLPKSLQRVHAEMLKAGAQLREEATEDGLDPDSQPTLSELYEALKRALADDPRKAGAEIPKPSQEFETWRTYAGRVEKALDKPRRPRRA